VQEYETETAKRRDKKEQKLKKCNNGKKVGVNVIVYANFFVTFAQIIFFLYDKD